MQRRFELIGRQTGQRRSPELDGEAVQRTDRLLRKLPERDWTVVAGIAGKHGAEHVLIGPGGVFVIASRKPEGVGAARVKDGMLWLRKGADPRADKSAGAINRDALESARVLHKEIRMRTGRGPVVQPVVVLWCEFPQAVAESDRIAFVRGKDLLDWVSHKPQRLDALGRAEVAQAVAAIPSGHDAASGRWRGRQISIRRRSA
ncbi:MAG TPA: hypothetical protein VGF95_12855 [Solirubrobacteraceae bacterium]|jgi:hypothetical protein